MRTKPLCLVLLVSIGYGNCAPLSAQQDHFSFAGRWEGTLRIESQDSYRGNNAKGAHKISSEAWVFDISPDEKTVSFYRAQWKGPKTPAPIVHKNSHLVTWHVSTKASASTPTAFYDKNGRLLGNGIGIRPDFDADWEMRITSAGVASIVCTSNNENIYARITDSRVTGILKKQ
jgi:hypothetical protein